MDELRKAIQEILDVLKGYSKGVDYLEGEGLRTSLNNLISKSSLAHEKCVDFLWFELANILDESIQNIDLSAKIANIINK